MTSGPFREPNRHPPSKARALLGGIPLGLLAGLLLWFGDLHLTHRDWLLGAAVFLLGLAVAFVAVGFFRRAGLLR